MSTKIHGKFKCSQGSSGGIEKTTCRIKENVHTRKLKSKFHRKEKVSFGKI